MADGDGGRMDRTDWTQTAKQELKREGVAQSKASQATRQQQEGVTKRDSLVVQRKTCTRPLYNTQ